MFIFVFTEEPFNADLPKGSTLKRATPPQSTSPQSQPQPSQWAQSLIQESPQVPSDVSSPNQPPVQFDFSKPVPSDPVSGNNTPGQNIVYQDESFLI